MTPTSGPLPRWTPERAVDADRARELVEAGFPQLRDRPVVRFAEGWDNTVHLVDGTWAFRFPRRAIALPGVRLELAVLPRIAPRLPLPIPVPELIGDDGDPVDPWPFSGARLIPGQELADASLADDARVDLAVAVGGFLRVLHSAELRDELQAELVAEPDGPQLPLDPNRRGHPQARLPDTLGTLARITADSLWTPDPAVAELLAEAGRLPSPPSGESVLVHGDLHVRHLLVDAAGAASGVIDWGDLALADPAVDLALAYAGFDGPARAGLLSAYGPVGAERELRARALAVRLSAFLLAYAADVARPTLLVEAGAGLSRAVS